ncbi:immunoglobulin E-set [Phakopsora pachyrhizi]|nr:immunoglobulin E-set [Phakopsora pachyrhizi]
MSSSAQNPTNDDEDLQPSHTAGYNPGKAKTLDEYAKLDAEDESLRKWKESLGIVAGAAAAGKPNLVVHSLSLHSPSLTTPIVMDLTRPENLQKFKKEPITIKEGVEYSVEISFKVEGGVVSGVKYLQVVKRAGVRMDKLESMIGSYGPCDDLHVKRFVSEESPSGMLARSGTYLARSRVIDDDDTVWADFEFFKVYVKE